MQRWAGGGVGVAARDCHLHLREEGDGGNRATERHQGDFGDGQNVLEQLDRRRVGAAEGKGMVKDGERGGKRGGQPLWPSCRGVCRISQRRDGTSALPEPGRELGPSLPEPPGDRALRWPRRRPRPQAAAPARAAGR